MKLYELSNNVIGLRDMLDDEMIDDQTFLDTLEGIEGEIEAKTENLLKFEREILADVSAIDAEIKRLTRIKSARQNRAKALREYLRFNMDRSGITKIASPMFTATLKAPSKVLVVENEDEIPEEYWRVKTTRSLDRKAVLDALKEGVEIPGATIGESKRALLVR